MGGNTMNKSLVLTTFMTLLLNMGCTTPLPTSANPRTPATQTNDDSASDRLHHQKVLNRIDQINTRTK
jgi:hypothetical protein